MKTSLKKSSVITIIVLAAVGIVAAIVVTVFAGQALKSATAKRSAAVRQLPRDSAKEVPQPNALPPRSEWATYKNAHNYELSFPKGDEWNVVDGTEGQMHATDIQYLLVPNRGCPLDLSDCPEILLQISVLKDNDWNKLVDKFAPPLVDATLNGVPAKRYETNKDTFGYLVHNGSDILQINFRYANSMKITRDVAEEILSTLKFADIIKY
jgi:hypothetical protein